jgi:hypothetical protein
MPKPPAILLARPGNSKTGISHKNAVIVASLNPSNDAVPDIPVNSCVRLVRYQNNKNDRPVVRLNIDIYNCFIILMTVLIAKPMPH